MTMAKELNETRFAHITTFGRKLEPTDYADGFNVGEVVTYDVGWTMSLPKFALIVRRTPKMIFTVALPTVKTSTDGGFSGHEKPVARVYIPEDAELRRTRMSKRGFFLSGRYTKVWDGTPEWYDHMD